MVHWASWFFMTIYMDDYTCFVSYHTFEQVERSMERVEVKDKNDLAVFDWFRTYVIGTKLDTGIGHHDLVGHY